MATTGVDNWPILTIRLTLSFDTSLHNNPSEYPDKPYITGN